MNFRLDTLDCVTVFIFAEPYIFDCVALLYHVLLLFSFSVNYCILHIAFLILTSRGLVHVG